MKNLKNLIYLILAMLVFTACENDDFEAAESVYINSSEVSIEFTDENDGMTVLEDGGVVTYEIEISQALPFDGVVTLGISSSDDSIETTGGITEVSYATATIPAGSTTTLVTLTFVDDQLPDVSEMYTVVVENLEGFDGQADYYLVNGESAVRTINVVDSLPAEVITITGDVNVTLTWLDGGYDMDLYLVEGNQDLGGYVIDSSLGYTTTEITTLPAAQPDGEVSIYINQYGFTADVDYTITFDFPDATQEIIEGTVIEDGFVITFNKTTNGSDITYFITQL